MRASPRWVLLAVPVGSLLVLGFTHRWMADDGFIYLRIVRQLVEGRGPVFNAGERVEAYTSPTWVALLALSDLALPIRLEWIAVLLGLSLSALGVIAAMAGSLRLAQRPGEAPTGRHPIHVPVGALVLAAPFALWVWQTSGLETGLTWAWLGSCAYVLGRWAAEDRSTGRAEAVLLGLGWLVRPELVLFSALFVLVVVAGEWRATSRRDRLRTVSWMVAVPVLYQLFRMGYFGLLVANTAIAKEGTSFNWTRGLRYLRDFVDPYWLWFPALLLVVGGYLPLARGATRRHQLVLGAFLGGSVLAAGYVVAVGGDYFHARFFVPVLFAFCAPVAAVPLQRRFVGLAPILPWALVTLFVLRPIQLERPYEATTSLPSTYADVTVEDLGWGPGDERIAWYGGDPLAVESAAFGLRFSPAAFPVADDAPTPAVLVSAVGLVGYALGPDVHIVDGLGLGHPYGSHFESNPDQRGAPGHDKPIPAAWVLAELADPDAAIPPDPLGIVQGGMIPRADGAALDAQVDDARRALACTPIRRLLNASRADLGPRSILRNLVQAPGNTALRFSPDPGEAAEQLC